MNKEEIWKQHFTLNGCLAETLFRPEMKKAIEDAMDDYAMRQAKNISSKPITYSLPPSELISLKEYYDKIWKGSNGCRSQGQVDAEKISKDIEKRLDNMAVNLR